MTKSRGRTAELGSPKREQNKLGKCMQCNMGDTMMRSALLAWARGEQSENVTMETKLCDRCTEIRKFADVIRKEKEAVARLR